MAKHMLVARVPPSLEMVRDAALRAAYGVGLGFAFYLMLGSFLNERFNVRLIVGTGILIQLLISVLSTIIVVYAIAPTTPERLLSYVYSGEEGAIALMGDLPEILSDYPGLLVLIAVSVFFAGITSLLPTAEVGLQITESMLRVSRNKAAVYVIGAAAILGVLDSPPSIADMVLKATTVAIFFTSIYELYPVIIREREKPLKVVIAGVSIALFLIGGFEALISTFRWGGVYVLSGILAIILVLFGLFGEKVLPREESL